MWVKQFFVSISLAAVTSAQAQLFNSLSVHVVDQDNHPAKGALLKILNTSFVYQANEQGIIHITNLRDGSYAATITAEGFATAEMVLTVGGNVTQAVVQLSSSAQRLDEVVVSSDRRESNIREVPTSVSFFNSKRIRDFRLWKTDDLSGIVPNLYTAGPGDGRNVTSVRGIVSTSYDPAVNTAIDGVTQFTLDTYIPQLFDAASIEILRGPQGTLYGRNSMGGVINILTRQPSNKTSGAIEVNAGNYGTQRYTAAIQGPVVKNKLFVGAALLYHRTNGFYKNEISGRNFDKQNGIGGNYYLKYKPVSRFTATLNFKHLHQSNDGAFTLAGTPEAALADPFIVQQNAVGKMKDQTQNASLSLLYELTNVNISFQSAYQSNYRYYADPLDGDFSPIDGITIINNYGSDWNRVRVFTQELRFSSPARHADKWQWVGGAYLFSQYSPTKQATHFGKDAAMVGSPDTDYSIINTSKVKNIGIALFGQAIYFINSKWSLKGGLRYDHQRSRATVLGEYQPDGAPAPVFNTRPDTSAHHSFKAISPVASIQFKIGTYSHLFLSYNRGYRTGGLSQISADPSQPPLYAYRPEYSNSFEIGSKNILWNNRFRLHAALFYSLVKDVQVPTLVLPEAFTLTRNAGRMRSYGAEIEFTGLLAKGLTLDYHGGITSAKYTKLKLSKNGQEQDLRGNRQLFTPTGTSLTAMQYEHRFGRGDRWTGLARMEWIVIGNQYFDLANSIRQPTYQLIHMRVGIAYQKLGLYGWIRNLTDQRYIAYAYDFGATRLGNPRTLGVSLIARFE